jgi:formiminoglutamase
MVLPANFSARDLGDLDISGDLIQDHRAAFEKTLSILAHTAVLSLGGGHDWAYPDGMAFINWAKEHLAPTTKNPVKPLIVNFDAHLDLRPIPNGAVHSGNPFRKLILETPLPFDLLEVGIQDHCNAKAHMKFAQDHAVSVLKLEDCTKLEFLDCLQAFLPESSQTQGKTRSKPKRPCFISVDIDSLSQVFAPGASASYPTGLKISFLLWAIKILKSQFAVKIAGIYEVSPPYDIEGITAKSAALVAYEILKD